MGAITSPLWLLEPFPNRPRLVADINVVRSYLRVGERVERITATRAETLEELAGPCKVPPEGWSCTRGDGHEGPCAAQPAACPTRRTGHIGRTHRERRAG